MIQVKGHTTLPMSEVVPLRKLRNGTGEENIGFCRNSGNKLHGLSDIGVTSCFMVSSSICNGGYTKH